MEEKRRQRLEEDKVRCGPGAEAGGLSVPEMPHAYCEPSHGGAGTDTQRNGGVSFPDSHSLLEVGCGRQVENVWRW